VPHKTPVNRPTQVKVGVFTWDVVFDSKAVHKNAREQGEDRLGYTSIVDHIIYVDDSRDKLRAIQNTLVHEINHVIFYQAGVDFDEAGKLSDPDEQVVAQIDHIWLGIIRDNPDVIAWLQLDEE